MKVANLAEFAHLVIHDEPQVQVNSKIVHNIARLQNGADGLHVLFSKELAGAQPDELGFVGVQSKLI